MNVSALRTRWAAIGAAVAVTLGAGGLGISYATSPAGAVAYVPITPCRLIDTRPAPDTVGSRNTPLGANETLTVTAHGANGNCTAGSVIPASATGLQLNVTAIGTTAPTFITVWPSGATQPTSSNLNPLPGQGPVPNSVTTGLSVDGKFNVFNNQGTVNVFVDVVGYYTDHNHDDRYYTKSEVDALLAAQPTLYTATVTAGGVLMRGVGAVSVVREGVGLYQVYFATEVNACTYTASPGGHLLGVEPDTTVSIQPYGANQRAVFVSADNTNTGAARDTGFHVIVVCP